MAKINRMIDTTQQSTKTEQYIFRQSEGETFSFPLGTTINVTVFSNLIP